MNRRSTLFLLLYVAAVLYLSLYPWRFVPSSRGLGWVPLNTRRTILDAFLNVVFYMPLRGRLSVVAATTSCLRRSLGLRIARFVRGGVGTTLYPGPSWKPDRSDVQQSGYVVGHRSDLDPAVIGFLARKENVSVDEVERWLNMESGMLGISGISQDMRILVERAKTDERARLALDVFCYRVKKYVGSYLAAMGGAAAIVFSGGIGEGAAGIRQSICDGLESFGVELDPTRNADKSGERCITRAGSRLPAYVIPTDEGLMMAHLALRSHAGDAR